MVQEYQDTAVALTGKIFNTFCSVVSAKMAYDLSRQMSICGSTNLAGFQGGKVFYICLIINLLLFCRTFLRYNLFIFRYKCDSPNIPSRAILHPVII